MNRLILWILCSIFFWGCTNNTSKLDSEQREIIDNAQEQINSLNERAENDSVFSKTPEYAAEMERKQIEIAKSMRGLTVNERLLQKYELSLNDLNTYSIRLKKNPDLAKNSFFMETFQKHGNSVREFYQILSETQLSSTEKKHFDELTSNKKTY